MRGKQLIQKKKRYKRLKRVSWTLFFILLCLYLAGFLYMYYASKGPESGRQFITRTTPRTIAFTGSQVPVDLTLYPGALSSQPPEGGRPLDIIIGLDNSISIRVAGNDNILRDIATKLLDNTDLEKHQVGIARLDDQARVLQGLSRNREVLNNVINEIPQGISTRIDEGLTAMATEFNSIRRRPGSLGVAIILSDGDSSEERTPAAADAFKQQENLFIATIGVGEDINDSMMRKIASWPTEYDKVVPDTEITDEEERYQKFLDKISRIYNDWTKILEQLVAVDIEITEYYNRSGLGFVNTSPSPPGLVNSDSGSIKWSIPYLTTQSAHFRYLHQARHILWHQLDPATGIVTLKPVGIDKKEIPIHRNPKVIILSPLLLMLLLLLLFLPLIPLLIAWLLRLWAARGPALLPDEIDPAKAFPTPPLLPGLQLDKLIRNTAPTLIIGLGGTGRWVLTYLKKAVMETNYGHIPDTLKFLLIDTYEDELLGDGSGKVEVGDVQLTEDEFLILNEGTNSPEKLLQRTKQMEENPDTEPHLEKWWPAKAFKELNPEDFRISGGTKKRRPFGRMSIFLDLENGETDSLFHTRVSGLIDELGEIEKGVNVFIASSLSGGLGSGMLLDVAYLARDIARKQSVEGVSVHAILALQNTFAAYSDSLDLNTPNTFAALRELDRFLSCRDFNFPMNYSPQSDSSVNGHLEAPLLDNCYLFDGEREPFTLHRELPQYGVFPSMADTIHTFLYNTSGGAFDQEVRQRKAVSELEREESGHGVASSLGTFVYRLPMYDFVQTFKYRFAKDITADLFGLYKNDKNEWGLAPLSSKDHDLLDKELEEFLLADGAERSPADVMHTVALRDTEMLAAVIEADRAHKNREKYVNQHKLNFGRYLARHFMKLLNDDSLESAHASGNPGDGAGIPMERDRFFSAALYISQKLSKRLEEVADLDTGSNKYETIARELLEHYRDISKTVYDELSGYVDMVLKGNTGDDPLHTNDSPAKGTETKPKRRPPLISYLEKNEEQQLANRKNDESILVREYLYDKKMENKLYEDFLGDTIRKEHLPRFVWHCREDNGRVEVRLKLAAHQIKTIKPDAGATNNAQRVTALPEILLQSLWDIDITPYLETAYPDPEDVARNIHEKSSPLITFEENKAVRHTEKMFLSLTGSDYLEDLIKSMRPEFPSREHVKGTEFRDAHAFSTITVLDSLPLNSIRPYEQAMTRYLALPAQHRLQLHVFGAEQNATVYEEMLTNIREPKKAFHPRFISLLEHLDFVRLFARCAVYGILPNVFKFDVDRYYLELDGQSGKERFYLTRKDPTNRPVLLDALRAFTDKTGRDEKGEFIDLPIQRISDFLEANRPDKKALLKTEKQIITMKENKQIDEADHNLLSFIHLILDEELN